MTLRRSFAALAAIALGGALAITAATPANAAIHAVQTGDSGWWDVSDTSASIGDAGSFTPDFLGTGIAVYGWTYDAFDYFPFEDAASAYLAFFGGPLQPWQGWTTDSGPAQVGDVWTVTISSSTGDIGSGNQLDVEITLTLEGSFARWDVDFDLAGPDPDLWTFTMMGELGSDEHSTYIPVGSDRMVSHDRGQGPDPILGWQLIGPSSFDVSNDDDEVLIYSTPEDGGFSLLLGQLEYDPCSHPAAVAAMTGHLAQFETLAGSVLPPIYADDCVVYDDELSFPIGTAFVRNIDLASNSEIDSAVDGPYYFESSGYDGDGWQEQVYQTAVLLSGPAGLIVQLLVDDATNTAQLRFSGSVSPAAWQAFGNAPIQVALLQVYQYDEDGDDSHVEYYAPLLLTFPGSSAEMPATGSGDSSAAALGGLGLVALGAVLALTARRRIRSS